MQQYFYRKPVTPEGYKSLELKNKYTTYVIALVVVLFMGLPFVFFLFMGPTFMLSSVRDMRVGQVNRGTFYQGSIWYPESSFNNPQSKTTLKKLTPGEKPKPESIIDIPINDVWLISDKDRMWIVSHNGLLEYKDGKLSEIYRKRSKAKISRPFFYKGNPAVVVEAKRDLFRIRYFDKGKWNDAEEFEIIDDSEHKSYSSISDIQILNCDDKLYVFHNRGAELYCFEGIPGKENNLSGKWVKVTGTFGADWTTTCYKGSPMVIVGNRPIPFSSPKTKFITRKGNSWKELFEKKTGITTSMGAYYDSRRNNLYLLISGFPGSGQFFSIKGNKIVNKGRLGKGGFFPFPTSFIWMIMIFNFIALIIFPALTIIFISKWTKEYRITEFTFRGRKYKYALLLKRGIAKLIDSVIFYTPAFIAYLYFVRAFFNFEIFFPFELPTNFFILILVVMLWSALMLFIFSYMEGSSGQTPGKRIMKIKVLSADDLENCGFLRALGRNIAMVIDQMFNSLVGILTISFTGRYQRVGDMLGNTIVVDCGEQRAEDGLRRTDSGERRTEDG